MLNPKIDTIITLSKMKNYTKTAEFLHMTQPAVTQHVKAIEEEYNVKLFKKNGKDLLPTKEGHIILKYFERLKTMNHSLEVALNDFKDKRFHLDIGMTPTASEYLVPLIFKSIYKINPHVSINFHIHVLNELYERMKSFEFDFCIIDELFTSRKYITKQFYKDELVFIASNDNPITNKKTISLNDLANENLILRHPKSATRTIFENYLYLSNDTIDRYHIILEIENIHIIKQLVKDNYGVSILPLSACKSDIEKGKIKIINVSDFQIKRGTYITYPKENDNSVLIDNIVTSLVKSL